MIDRSTFQAWASKGHFTDWDRKPERLAEIEDMVKRTCDRIPTGRYLSTTALIEAMLPGLDERGRQYILSALAYLRKEGRLSAYVRRGPPNQRTFGKQSVEWVSPATLLGTAGLEDVLN